MGRPVEYDAPLVSDAKNLALWGLESLITRKIGSAISPRLPSVQPAQPRLPETAAVQNKPSPAQFSPTANIPAPQFTPASARPIRIAHNASEHPPIVLSHPVVQSRINLQTGNAREGWQHIVAGHFSNTRNKSQFTISQDELRDLLQHRDVVSVPITRTILSSEKLPNGTLVDRIIYERVAHINRQIGLDKFNSNNSTNILTIHTDKYGNLITATPGRVK